MCKSLREIIQFLNHGWTDLINNHHANSMMGLAEIWHKNYI